MDGVGSSRVEPRVAGNVHRGGGAGVRREGRKGGGLGCEDETERRGVGRVEMGEAITVGMAYSDPH